MSDTFRERLVRPEEAADLLGYKKKYLLRLAAEGRMPSVRPFGTAYRFRMSDLAKLIAG